MGRDNILKRVAVFMVGFLMGCTGNDLAAEPVNAIDASTRVVNMFCEKTGGKWKGNLCVKNGGSDPVLKDGFSDCFEIVDFEGGKGLLAKMPVIVPRLEIR